MRIALGQLLSTYDPAENLRTVADLARRGWSTARMEKLMGGNFLRYARDVWGA